jgi:hypothetical protein
VFLFALCQQEFPTLQTLITANSRNNRLCLDIGKMLYKGLRLAARTAPKFSLYNTSSALRQLPVQFQHVRTYADTVVKVPPMAESISEGTLRQWNKAIGERVEQDDEIATIETDKVCVPAFLPVPAAGLHAMPA